MSAQSVKYCAPAPALTAGAGLPVWLGRGLGLGLGLWGVLLLAGATDGMAAPPMEKRNSALLQGLDKVTARVWGFEASVGQTLPFGTLRVTVQTCRQTPAEETPEAAAFLVITEERPNETPLTRFSGWMFASSPALSSLEHPVYDIWVTGCGER